MGSSQDLVTGLLVTRSPDIPHTLPEAPTYLLPLKQHLPAAAEAATQRGETCIETLLFCDKYIALL